MPRSISSNNFWCLFHLLYTFCLSPLHFCLQSFFWASPSSAKNTPTMNFMRVFFNVWLHFEGLSSSLHEPRHISAKRKFLRPWIKWWIPVALYPIAMNLTAVLCLTRSASTGTTIRVVWWRCIFTPQSSLKVRFSLMRCKTSTAWRC